MTKELQVLSEKQFGLWLEGLCRIHKWDYYHTWNSKNSVGGWPDYVLVKPPRIIFSELKVGKNKLTDKQKFWLSLLEKVPNVEVYVWYPKDRSGIEEVLVKGRDGA